MKQTESIRRKYAELYGRGKPQPFAKTTHFEQAGGMKPSKVSTDRARLSCFSHGSLSFWWCEYEPSTFLNQPTIKRSTGEKVDNNASATSEL
jgi:hypothetical protein